MSIFKRKHESVAPHEMDDGLSRNEFLRTMVAAAAMPVAAKVLGDYPNIQEPQVPKRRQSMTTVTNPDLCASYVPSSLFATCAVFSQVTVRDYHKGEL